MSVAEKYLQLRQEVAEIARRCGRDPAHITLVAVTKGYSLEHVLHAYEAGCRDFGESRVQGALEKLSRAPKDIRWHFIGNLQKNKVRKVIGKFALIHSVDGIELAKKISDCSVEAGCVTSVLLEANTSGERTKHGMPPSGWKEAIRDVGAMAGIHIEGLMTMAPLVEDERVIRQTFAGLRALRDDLEGMLGEKGALPHLSMGMTHDYRIAIEEGATLLRVGTALFA